MKRKNPLRPTVKNWISRRPRKFKSRLTMLEFFNDLENRGPFHHNSLFRQWTSSIREDMIAAGTWVKRANPGQKSCICFVQEYISRLQLKFWTMEKNQEEYWVVVNNTHDISLPYYTKSLDLHGIRTFKMIYKMIRIFGLRMKLFCLLKPRWYKGMKYRHLLIESAITDYTFGKEHIEKAWGYYWARHRPKFRKEIYFCTPLKMNRYPW